MTTKIQRAMVMVYVKGTVESEDIDKAKKELGKTGIFLVAVPFTGTVYPEMRDHGVYAVDAANDDQNYVDVAPNPTGTERQLT